ncbi:MAG: fused MFS/spermidine synthase [Verrucomicrobia bacterium]|nr:fused MFS/spermidine synthase [Verrucomicrobiota bacterium]
MKKPAPPSTSASPTRSVGERRFLYLTAAVAGGVLMVVEILGAKMLAPYFGTSHFVWVAQIGVTLAALASGYYLGGRLADRSPRLTLLYGALLLAAVWLALTVVMTEPVAYACLDFRLAVGSVLASLILYFVPLTLLAMTGPFLIRTISESLVNLGAQVGRLSAISTFGSFVGTAGIGYVLIPLLPNSTTMLLNAGLLVVLATVYFLVWARRPNPASKLIAVWAVIGLAAALEARVQTARLSGAQELFRGNSHFGMLQVVEHEGTRYYLNDFLTQNLYDPKTKQGTAMFTYMLAELARAYSPRLDSALCIGMGVGIVPMDFAHAGMRVDVVEINPAIVPVAQKFFDFDPAKAHVTIDDGRHFLNRTTNRYDAVILDAFLGDSSPAHLMSREAFASMRRVLTTNGVLVINCFGELDPHNNYFTASLDKTLRTVFKSVRIHADGSGNLFFVATDQGELPEPRMPDLTKMHPSVRSRVERAFNRVLAVPPADGIVLTDNYNPVDYYDARNREELRKQLAFSMKDK